MCMRTGLRKIHIPSSVRSIGAAAFYQCSFLARRVLSRNNMLRVVGFEAFGGTRLTSSLNARGPDEAANEK